MRIAIAASGRLGASVARPLVASKHKVVAIVQDGRQTRGIWRVLAKLGAYVLGGANSMHAVALRNGIPVFYIDKMDERELAPLRRLDIDVLLVSGFAIILKKPLLELPRIGCVNMHSSLLPRHRGPNPFSAAILHGDTHTGITFHVMEEGIDTGPVLDQASFEIGPRDEMLTVYHRACELAGERVLPLMDRIAREGLVGTPQDHSRASYDPKPTEADTWIDWNRSAVELDRMVRGLSPSTMARFRHGENTVYIAKSVPLDTPAGAPPGTVLQSTQPVRVATGEGVLEISMALCKKPIPWVWPSPFSRPVTGEKLE
jgi:methionyl-tRNA formyltransferase